MDALRGVSIDFAAGRYTAIMGPSGSGKSTLMNLLAGLDKPTSGTVTVDGTDITTLDDGEAHAAPARQARLRLPVLQPAPGPERARRTSSSRVRIAGRDADQDWVDQLIETIGLGDRRTHRPSQLSGGQQQRVAIARALASKPAVIFADEPTGNLDSKASDGILELLRRAVDEFGQTVVMVTHDAHAASFADQLVVLVDGQVVQDREAPSADEILDVMKSVA